MEAVWQAIRDAVARGGRGVVATVTRARGSTYRREGARMFIPVQGEPVGSLSGGCLEGDVLEVARQVLADGRSRRVGYDMMADDDALWGMGLGCNGAVEILLEPLSAWHAQLWRWRDQGELRAVVTPLPPLESRDPAGLTPDDAGDDASANAAPGTVAESGSGPAADLGPAAGTGRAGEGAGEAGSSGTGAWQEEPASAGDGRRPGGSAGADRAGREGRPADGGAGIAGGQTPRLVVAADGSVEGTLGSASLDGQLRELARQWLPAGRSGTVAASGAGEFFLETLVPPPTLLLCGAGHDAVPVVAAAAPLGYRVVVADSRPAFARPERFPGAHRVIHAYPEDLRSLVTVDERTYVVIMTHNFLQDVRYLAAVLDTPARYIGLLGPRSRAERLLAELRQQGVEPQPHQLERIHAPVGLDIGGESPEEIAHSLLAEVQAVRYGRGAGFLRDRQGPIHPRYDEAQAPSA